MSVILFVSLTVQISAFSVKSDSQKNNNREGQTVKNKDVQATEQRYHFHSQLPACLQCRKSEVCQVLLTLMEFWQENQLHCSQIKGKGHSSPLLLCIISWLTFSSTDPLNTPQTPLPLLFISQYQRS